MNVTYLLSRLSVRALQPLVEQNAIRSFSLNSVHLIKLTQYLQGAPLKKRVKMDPGQIRLKEEKRKRKLEKEIRRLRKFAQTLKPIEESQLPLHIQDQRELEYSQRLALDKLREESEELYQAAIQLDNSLINVSIKGPTITPPIKDYDSPDGDYVNTSFKWD
ncbi:39S ribosomal protein L40, mitochondrial [Frankliniella fusca]|uniref:Large ribosomal subunit protein mL40 n=1 Tax=Frankliniella fusca TaxID=407009 RepID=A0AAE1HLY3_9NEOP|nr:39S ribosomal protein L40, mitochondrial [Frankliniella fusca]